MTPLAMLFALAISTAPAQTDSERMQLITAGQTIAQPVLHSTDKRIVVDMGGSIWK